MKSRAITIEVICGLFILLFVYAAVSKLLDVEKFRVQVGAIAFTNAHGWICSMVYTNRGDIDIDNADDRQNQAGRFIRIVRINGTVYGLYCCNNTI